MMKLSAHSALLFAAAIAVCAFAIPSMASAATWGPIGSEHRLDIPSLHEEYQGGGLVAFTSSCPALSLTTFVNSAAVMTITAASFSSSCVATGVAVGTCTKSWTAKGLPWRATATTTTDIQIHGVQIDALLAGGSCTAAGVHITITGTLRGGHWNGNGAGQHEVIFNGAPGLTAQFGLLPLQVTVSGTLRDTVQTLTVNP